MVERRGWVLTARAHPHRAFTTTHTTPTYTFPATPACTAHRVTTDNTLRAGYSHTTPAMPATPTHFTPTRIYATHARRRSTRSALSLYASEPDSSVRGLLPAHTTFPFVKQWHAFLFLYTARSCTCPCVPPLCPLPCSSCTCLCCCTRHFPFYTATRFPTTTLLHSYYTFTPPFAVFPSLFPPLPSFTTCSLPCHTTTLPSPFCSHHHFPLPPPILPSPHPTFYHTCLCCFVWIRVGLEGEGWDIC